MNKRRRKKEFKKYFKGCIKINGRAIGFVTGFKVQHDQNLLNNVVEFVPQEYSLSVTRTEQWNPETVKKVFNYDSNFMLKV